MLLEARARWIGLYGRAQSEETGWEVARMASRPPRSLDARYSILDQAWSRWLAAREGLAYVSVVRRREHHGG